MTHKPITRVYQKTFDRPTTSVKAVSVYATESLSMLSKDSIKSKTQGWFHRLIELCFGKDRYSDYDEPSKSIDIGYPTNFRREDITFPGLAEDQQSFLREKARTDAHNMYSQLQPLRSSPSGHFVQRPTPTTTPAPSPQKPTRVPVGMPASPDSIQKTPSPMHRLGNANRTEMGVDEKRETFGDVVPYEIQALLFDEGRDFSDEVVVTKTEKDGKF